MLKPEVKKSILSKAFRETKLPFKKLSDHLEWHGGTSVKSKSTGRVYPVQVEITLVPERRSRQELEACLCKTEGVRLEDFMVVAVIEPKLRGVIKMSGLPANEPDLDLSKFLRQLNTVNS